MRIGLTCALAALLLTTANIANAQEVSRLPAVAAKFPNTPAKALQFAARNPDFMRKAAAARSDEPLEMTPQLMELLQRVNVEGNSLIKWVDDRTAWGEVENWDFPCEKDKKLYDDCDGIALWKMRRLMELGVPSTPLLITQGTYDQYGHAMLVVTTTAGDYVLDNRRSEVVTVADLTRIGYTFLLRPERGDNLAGDWVQIGTPMFPQQHYAAQAPRKRVAPSKHLFGMPLCVPRKY